ncbi:MAG: hypothetical protein IT208_16805 [Chthonomonadales bacterium]|nr:hypothetical protein [Chthonomonadales bacterium]
MRVPDGRIGRVRAVSAGCCKVRVRRRTSKSHQFLELRGTELERVECPKGWMSPAGYNRYLELTLARMEERRRGERSREPR